MGEDRYAAACREISKVYEETVRGTLKELMFHFEMNEPKGEFVIILSGKNEKINRE
jgi:16S rRNA (cytidine1402-2'-O)-methyltransferase